MHEIMVGGGYAGFHTAWGLEKKLRKGEARVTVIDPRPTMTYMDGHVVPSNGEEFDSALIVWTAGNASNPVVHNHTDLPVGARGLIPVWPGLRAGIRGGLVADALFGRDLVSLAAVQRPRDAFVEDSENTP